MSTKIATFAALIIVMVGQLPLAASAAKIVTFHESGSDAALLLIHGLEGSAEKSFVDETSGLSWVELIRSDDRVLVGNKTLSSFDIYAVDYSDVFVGANVVNVSVEEMAQQVASALETHNLLRDYNHIWVVAHSLGGIVIKRVLNKWSVAGRTRYIDRIIGVSLLGVPSNGTPLANIGETDFGKIIGTWMGFNAAHINDLRTIDNMNTFLRSVENDWSNFLAGRRSGLPRVSCAYETVAEYSFGGFLGLFSTTVTIVPEIYTKTGCDGEAQPINKSHIALPKPNGHDDAIQDWLFGAVREAMIKLGSTGEGFENADRVGALWDLIQHIRRGHRRRDDRTDLPYIDQTVSVSASDIPSLKALRLKNSRYVGATWADVLERVSDDNACVVVNVKDRVRRNIVLSLNDLASCAGNGELVCDLEACR